MGGEGERHHASQRECLVVNPGAEYKVYDSGIVSGNPVNLISRSVIFKILL